MSQLKLCLITPSYEPDFARCRLLAESVDKFFTCDINHYIVVPRKDFKLFKQLQKPQRIPIVVESILPWWIKKIPLVKNGWFSWKTLPIRNWIIQQIVKLEVANHLQEDVLIFADSDVAFVKPFDPRQVVRDGKVRLFRESVALSLLDELNLEPPYEWYNTANSLLNLAPFKFTDQNPVINYVGQIVTWKRDNVLKLHQHIEQVTHKNWIEAVASHWDFAEYMLYGIFVDRILKEDSGHYWDSQKISYDYWGTTPLEQEQAQTFFQEIPPESSAVMISAKSKTPLEYYQPLI